MKRHPEIGEEIVGSVPGLTHLSGVIRAEHERWDGRGYPDGLAGERIPLCSRIVFACDAYHAMVTDRPYRQALGATEAQRELSSSAGSQLCPHAVGALLTVLHRAAASRRQPCHALDSARRSGRAAHAARPAR
jgi:HD-GYP domain-containing protein (c-di-GMP phosphodiesterase class II)